MPDQPLLPQFVARLLPWNNLRVSFCTSDGTMENNRECYRCTPNHPELTVLLFARGFDFPPDSLDHTELILAKRYDGTPESLHARWKGTGLPSRRIELLVGRTIGSRSKRLQLDRVSESHTLDTRAACRRLLGDLICTAHLTSKYLFLSVGSGIMQLASIVRWPDDLGSETDVLLVDGARTPADLVFREELIALARRSGFRSVAIGEWDALDDRWGDSRPRCPGSAPRPPGARGILLRRGTLQGRGAPCVQHGQPLHDPVSRRVLTSRPGRPRRVR